MDNEEWRGVVGVELHYQVSSLGRVRSLPGGKRQGKILKPGWASRGKYLLVSLYGRDSRYVHHLVAEAFIGPRPAGMDVCHNSGDPSDNRAENLRYGTRSENMLDVVVHGRSRASNTHCPSGHEFTEENTRHEQIKGRKGLVHRRVCRACDRARRRKAA